MDGSTFAIFDNVASTHYTSTPETSDVQNITGCSKYYWMFKILLDVQNITHRIFCG
jgi:hypothetical protein